MTSVAFLVDQLFAAAPGGMGTYIRQLVPALSRTEPSLDIALFHIAAPYPGTPFFFEVVRNNWFRDDVRWEEVDMDDLNPESIWRFRIKGFGPLLVTMDSHGGSIYDRVQDEAKARRAKILADLGASE